MSIINNTRNMAATNTMPLLNRDSASKDPQYLRNEPGERKATSTCSAQQRALLKDFVDITKNILIAGWDGIQTNLDPSIEKGKVSTAEDLKANYTPQQLKNFSDMSLLCKKVFLDDEAYNSDPLVGWRLISEAEFENKLGEDVTLDDPATGFQAGLYQNQNGDVVLAFRGSENPFKTGISESYKDWVLSDLGQSFLTVPKPYEQARQLATQVKEAFGRDDIDIQITGTSLGGGLANYAAVSQNLDYTIFNAVGLAEWTQEALGDKIAQYTAKGIVINDEFDPLTNMGRNQIDKTLGHNAKHVGYDEIIWIKGKNGMAFSDIHNMVNIMNVLNEVAAEV